MFISRWVIKLGAFFLCFFSLFSAVYAQGDLSGECLFKIHIPLAVGENAVVISGDKTFSMGAVRVLPTKSKCPAFSASRYGRGGQIVASAANAHHILLAVEEGKGRTISLVPTETFVPSSGMGAAIAVEGTGGLGLWGEYAPFVGAPVYAVQSDSSRVLLNDFALLENASAIEIDVRVPGLQVEYLEIENKRGGRAWYRDTAGEDHLFGIVESRVAGTGRFVGTYFEGRGRVRANHPGVICVSTTELGHIGGFQIIPLTHTFSKGMQQARYMGQYLIIRGQYAEDLTGKFPFFSGAVRPGDAACPESSIGKVMCKIEGNWYPIPNMPSWTEESLTHLEGLRIFLR